LRGELAADGGEEGGVQQPNRLLPQRREGMRGKVELDRGRRRRRRQLLLPCPPPRLLPLPRHPAGGREGGGRAACGGGGAAAGIRWLRVAEAVPRLLLRRLEGAVGLLGQRVQ